MKITSSGFFQASGLSIALALTSFAVQAQDAALIKRGEYLAVAGDCTACHTAENGKSFAGGYAFNMPMGTIISSNITPSRQFGIGNWSEAEFSKAVRDGVNPDGRHLYPAMPYTSYRYITDEDMHALYSYFQQGVTAVDAAPTEKTQLKFPFSLPGVMAVWDLLFAGNSSFIPDPALNAEQNRGKYLVDGLAHCSTCHTPRNAFMAEDSSKFLAGAYVDGWRASNITADPVSGIGGWSNQEITTYLKTGHVQNKAQAGGPMADAIQHSFSHMDDKDLQAIAAYLKTVTPVREQGQTRPDYAPGASNTVDWTSFEKSPYPASDSPDYIASNTTDGAVLYNTNCAACHGISGQGSDDGYFPSLRANTAVGSKDPANLVMAISEGIHRTSADGIASMPAFSAEDQRIHTELTPAQIAAVANYVTENFGHGDAQLTATDVNRIRSGGEPSFLIRYAAQLAIAGGVIFLLILLLLARIVLRKKH